MLHQALKSYLVWQCCQLLLKARFERNFLFSFYYRTRIENIEFVSFVKVSKSCNQWFLFSPFPFMTVKPKTNWPLKIRRPADEVWLFISVGDWMLKFYHLGTKEYFWIWIWFHPSVNPFSTIFPQNVYFALLKDSQVSRYNPCYLV